MTDFTDRFSTFVSFQTYVDDNFDVYPLSWTTGGMQGGSCWDEGDGNHYAVSSEPEPEFEVLDNILMDVCPNLTFLQYRKLMKADIVKVEDNSYSEYYGNYHEGKKKTLDIDALYIALGNFS